MKLKEILQSLIILYNLIFANSVELVTTPDGKGQFITGRGCGVNTPIKYLNYMPNNIDDFECSYVISDGYSEPLHDDVKSKLNYRRNCDCFHVILPSLQYESTIKHDHAKKIS